MPVSVDIPQINITPEAEEDDDHFIMNFSEALTDIEELDDDIYEPKSHVTNKKSKLKIKLTEQGDVTDLEDFEGSSDEENTRIVKHSHPVTTNDLDLEAPMTEESYKRQGKNSKGKRRIRTEFAIKQKSFYQSLSQEESDEGVATDSEAYDTENEITEVQIPESVIDLDLYKTDNLVADNLASLASTPAFSDNSDYDRSPENSIISAPQFLNALKIVANEDQGLTDVEMLQSDSDNEDQIKKTKTRRRKHRSSKKPSSTDLEELYLSDDILISKPNKKPKRKTKIVLVKSHSLHFDSENEDNAQLPFPICKLIAKKNSVSLRIPEFDTNFLTDTEDIEGGSDIEKGETDFMDEEALDDMLKNMASGYGQVNEQNKENEMEKKPQKMVETKIDIESDKETTDEDEFQADEAEENEIPAKDDGIVYKIKFSPSISNFKSKVPASTSHLSLPINTDDPVTDCENIDSSPDETELKKIPLACLLRQSLTDDEEFSDDDESAGVNLQEIQLPPPIRNLVLVQENDSLVPTVRILPLDSSNSDNEEPQDVEQVTDEENISEAEEALNLLNVQHNIRAATPDLPMLEGGSINVSENINKYGYCNSPVPSESVTDTEEVVLDKKHKRRRAPKFKYLYEKSIEKKKNICLPTNDKNMILTDTEDICLSDPLTNKYCTNDVVTLSVPQSSNTVLTDTENIDLSEDEQEYFCKRPPSVTPVHIKEMGGETVFLKEGSGPFSIIDRLEHDSFNLNTNNTFMTPATTDNEDLMVSAEEDLENTLSRSATATPNRIHNDLDQMSELTRKLDVVVPEEIMYLKGGGCAEQYTDNECLFYEKLLEESTEKENIALDLKNCLVTFGYSEWDASKKPAEISNQSALEQAAAQQGDEQIQPSQQPGSSSAKAEFEEVHDKAENEKSKKVSDQHQLSEEMKELLKEMEKETKQ